MNIITRLNRLKNNLMIIKMV